MFVPLRHASSVAHCYHFSQEPVPSPGLTYGSSATSEESSSYSHRPPQPPAPNPLPLFLTDTRDPQFPKHQGARAAIVPSTVDVPYIIPVAAGSNVTYPEVPVQFPPRPATPSGRAKLKKKNRGDGYESDGGYVSEAGRKKDKKKEGDDEKKEMKARLKEEKKEKEVERKRKKSLVSAVTRSSSKDKEKDKDSGYATGYETDGIKHSKSKSKKVKPKSSVGNIGGEYETDASSTPLKKSKSRFFKLSTKSSKPNLHEDVVPSPSMDKEREKEVFPLPIAGRFAAGVGVPPVPYMPPPTNSSPVLAPGASLASSLVLPPPERLPPITTHALDLDSVTSPVVSALTSSPVSAVTSPSVLSAIKKQSDRDSRSSASSGSSGGSNPRRRGLQFSPTHANGSGSYSTITSTSQSHSHPHGPPPPPSSMVYSPPGSAQGHLKPPSISFPVTRSPSPHAPVAPLNVVKGLKTKASLDAIPSNHYANSSRGVSPIPLSPDSPYVMVTPTTSSPPPFPPPIITAPIPPVRPRNPPTNGFGPRLLAPIQTQTPSAASLVPPPSPHVHFPFGAHEKPTHLSIVPSEDWVIPSPTSSQTSHVITPPNVLAYYDIPPPSPPPMGPLPVPPVDGGAGGGVFPTTSQLRARMHERGGGAAAKEFNQLVGVNGNNMQRGRELPFPARPVLLPTSNSSTSTAANPNSNGVVPGLEARVNLRRYRDLYAAPAGGWPDPQPQRRPSLQRRSDEEGGYHAEEEEEEEEDMKDVLGRFEDSDSDTEFINPNNARALETRRSFEAIKPKPGHESFAVSEYYGTRDTMYSFGGDRNSRWSGGSVYSRSSILDPDKSEEARERFLERVEAMLGGDEEEEERRGGGGGVRGRGQVGVVPPVPNIPERFASPRKNWPPEKF